jgi:hypothetical protein
LTHKLSLIDKPKSGSKSKKTAPPTNADFLPGCRFQFLIKHGTVWQICQPNHVSPDNEFFSSAILR